MEDVMKGGACVPPPTGKVVDTTGGRKHYDGNINVTEDWKLVGFLDEAISSLWECNLSIGGVLYSLYLEFNTTHFDPIIVVVIIVIV